MKKRILFKIDYILTMSFLGHLRLKFLKKKRSLLILTIILALGIVIRLLYFPDNIYFSYDQARDSFSSLEILGGHLKIIGPPSSFNNQLFHGPLIYYILAPIYFLSHNSLEWAAVLFRVFNALGVLIIYLVSSSIFNKKVALIAALLFALSYEQSQYALFFDHPALGVIFNLLFYLGMSRFIFSKDIKGLYISVGGIGLSIQSHFSSLILLIPFVSFLLIFKRQAPKLSLRHWAIAGGIFLLTVSSFILGEFKFGFRMSHSLLNLLKPPTTSTFYLVHHLKVVSFVILRWIQDNVFANGTGSFVVAIIFLTTIVAMLNLKASRPKAIFLLIWFLSGLAVYFLSQGPADLHGLSYYYGGASSVSLIILTAFLIFKLSEKIRIAAALVLILIILSNLSLILPNNRLGPNRAIEIQPGMLLGNEKQVIDYVYQQSNRQPFAVYALTIPLKVDTTWSFLFNWYGKEKYGYLPVWGGEAAYNYPSDLKVVTSQSQLPDRQFLIIEPTAGINNHDISDFYRTQNYFSRVINERMFGNLKVQDRSKI